MLKHSLLLAVLERLRVLGPLTVIDTHAGAGMYDLGSEAAKRSGEAQAGVARLMGETDAPPPLQALAGAVRACNPGDALGAYPGSPWLAARALGRKDAYLGCELRADDHEALRRAVQARADGPRLELLRGDGYDEAARRLEAASGRTLLLVDPPYERADDYARIAELIAARPRPLRQPALIWAPLKDLETFDAFLGALEDTRPGSLVAAQTRLGPLDDPMRMNGCVLVLVDAPELAAEAQRVCDWIATHLGGQGAHGRVERLAGPAT